MIKKTSDFINDDDGNNLDDAAGDNNEDSDDQNDLDCFDSVCSICDNGGELLWYVSVIFVFRQSLFNFLLRKEPSKYVVFCSSVILCVKLHN